MDLASLACPVSLIDDAREPGADGGIEVQLPSSAAAGVGSSVSEPLVSEPSFSEPSVATKENRGWRGLLIGWRGLLQDGDDEPVRLGLGLSCTRKIGFAARGPADRGTRGLSDQTSVCAFSSHCRACPCVVRCSESSLGSLLGGRRASGGADGPLRSVWSSVVAPTSTPRSNPAVLQSSMLDPGADGCGDGGAIIDPDSTSTLSRADLRAAAEALRRSQCSSTLLGSIIGSVRPRTWVLR